MCLLKLECVFIWGQYLESKQVKYSISFKGEGNVVINLQL